MHVHIELYFSMLTVREHPALGDFPSAGELENFLAGEIPQHWGNGIFLIVILVDLESSNNAIITQGQCWTIVDSIYKKKSGIGEKKFTSKSQLTVFSFPQIWGKLEYFFPRSGEIAPDLGTT